MQQLHLWTFLSVLFVALIDPSTGDASVRRRPNVLIIVADDLGAADLGYRGSTIRTPNLDRLSSEGIRLDRFYAHPFCSPTRAALQSGRFPGDFAFNIPGEKIPDGGSIAPETYTLSERFWDAGYQTGLVGKWHLGTSDEAHPNQNGFDYFYGLIGGVIGYFNKAWFGLHDWQRNGVELFDGRYSTTLLGKDAAAFIQGRDPSSPFFLMLSFNAPHFPADAIPSVASFYRSNTACQLVRHRCHYMAQVDTMDHEVGRVLDVLEAEGITEDTIIVFFSDNGGFEPFGAINAPFRGQKSSTFEGGIRVPAVVKWSGRLEEGTRSQQRMQVQDLYATLESAARLRRRAPRESRNMWPALRKGIEKRREPFYFTSLPPDFDLCAGCFRTIERYSAVLTRKWKLVTAVDIDEVGVPDPATRRTWLFDIRRDPFELEDLSAHAPRRVKILERKLKRRNLF